MPSAWDSYGPAPPGTGDLSPLPPKLRIGLEVIGALAVLSLLLCSALFLFITCRLVDGLRKETRRRKHLQLRASPNDSLDCNNASFEMGSPKGPRSPFSSHTPVSPCLKGGAVSTTQQLQDRSSVESRRVVMPNIRQRYKGYHPLLVLIYMLLIADIIQSASMIPNLVWVAHNAITVRSETCWAQGWLRSQGDMASSMFAAAVSVNTWLMVVKRYTIPSKLLWTVVASIWCFSFVIVAAGVWAAGNGAGHGGYFARVDTWCWISSEYANTRLWTHFGWVLTCMGIILTAYLSTVICIRPDPRWGRVVKIRDPRASGHHPAFFIYPLVYFICCVPMALGPMILLAGVTINAEYFIWAGAMIASNGWLDVIIWSCTMVFLAPKEIEKAGLGDFRFLRTDSVKYGNIVWVEGGRRDEHGGSSRGAFPTKSNGWSKRLIRMPSRAVDRSSSTSTNAAIMDGEGGIQIETSTVVEVESRRHSLFSNTPRSRGRVPDAVAVSVPARVAHFF